MNGYFSRLRKENPLIHCITNYVTAGDVANMILAAGGSAVMADGGQEVEEITSLSQALVINLGTLKEQTIPSMILAGKRAVYLGHPVVFDPVGAGASAFRTEAAKRILEEVPCTLIRGNASEIRTLILGSAYSKGVDADWREVAASLQQEGQIEIMQEFSRKTKAILVMTGQQDLVVSEQQACVVENGHPMMARITGCGCMLDGVLAAFLAVGQPDQRFFQSAFGVAAFGLCGELAGDKTNQTHGGTGSFRTYLLDAMSQMDDRAFQEGVKIAF